MNEYGFAQTRILFPSTLTRIGYLLRHVAWLLLLFGGGSIVIVVSLHAAKGLTHWTPAWGFWSFALPGIVIILMVVARIPCLDIPRLRSIGWSPWLALLLFVPYIGSILQFCLYLAPPDYAGRRSFFDVLVRLTLITVAILFVVAIVLGNRYRSAVPQKWAGAAKPAVIETTARPARAETPQANPQQAIPLVIPQGSAKAGLQVESIYYRNSSRSSAVVNGSSVMVKDQIGKWTVTEIHANCVMFRSNDGETSVVWLKENSNPSKNAHP